ncbi:hypothetical protein MVEN_00015400 [Mycena venus]|uniref:Uncharacterized protein n=1 Tax=Mycena venus TaxID=2733690 RepID=A0A8H6Z9E2_9AGAR|nr:hypothetical protein MVEN_00015400 [Mycena venus]
MSPSSSSTSKKGRKTARNSTGGKPPRVQLALVDDEAVESSDNGEEEADEGYEDSFIDDRELDDRTPSPVAEKQEKALDAGDPDSRPSGERGHTPPLTTRSRSKLNQTDNSDDTLDTAQAPSTSQLATTSHSQSQGVKSSSLDRPAGKGLEQTTLTVKPSPVSTVVNLTPEEYQALLAYRNSIATPVLKRQDIPQKMTVDDDQDIGSPPPRQAGRRVKIAPVLPEDDLPADVAKLFASSEGEQSTSSTSAKGKGKATRSRVSNVQGLKRSHEELEDNDTTVPANIEAAFNANAETTPPSKKKKNVAVTPGPSRQVLHTENVKTVTKSPSRCGVTDKSIQDPLLQKVYSTLPKNIKGNKEHYINLSRISPVGLQAISQVYGDRKRWTLSINGKTAICISVMMAVKSSLQEPSAVVAPSPKSRWSKFITAIPHAQEFERLVGVVCMAFHHKTLHAQIHCDAITFNMKTFTKDQKPAVRAKFREGVPSSSTKSASSRTYTSDDALHWEDDIPIYDGRESLLNFSQNIDDLDRVLPRFEDNDCEVPNGSCIAVAYTVSQYETSGKESVTFNIRFVVVIATPDDEDHVQQDEAAGEEQVDADSEAD